jgi:hypothetical protein
MHDGLAWKERAEVAEARCALLAAECRAWRMRDSGDVWGPIVSRDKVESARAATDAAGELEGGKP